ncbi:MAG: porin family protein [Gammaproteobacteria bacterium]|nr:porin family protein [Gammaproteobacteria bacterium]
MRNKRVMLGLIMSAFCSQALSEPFYAGGNFVLGSYDEDGMSTLDLNSAQFKWGYVINDNISAELRYGVGVGDDSDELFGFSFDVSIDQYYGAYVKAAFPTESRVDPYLVLGYTYADLEIDILGISASTDADDLSYGVGLDFRKDERWTINAEYMMYFDKDGGELSGLSFGVQYHFID